MQSSMSAQQLAAAWEQLPLGVQQHILVLTRPCTRRVSKAWRDAFDAASDTLCFWRLSNAEQRLKAAATAAATRVIKNSASLTAVDLMDCDGDLPEYPTYPFTLSDLLAAGAATGLATRLRKLAGVQLYEECAVQQLQALRQCTGLTHLDISSSKLEDWLPEQGHEAAFELTAALQGMHRLVRLRICQLQFKGAVAALASALQPLTQLQHLHVCCSSSQEAGVSALISALAPTLSAMPSLQTLDVSRSSLFKVEGAEALCGLLGALPGLTHLSVSGSNWGDEGAALLAPALGVMTCLQALNLHDTGIGDEEMVILAPALAALPRLQTLCLSANGLGEIAVSALQPVLAREGSPLRKLDIGQSSLRLESARALAEGLCAATQLWELGLQHTWWGNEGWVALAPALSCLAPSLQSLELAYDGLKNAGLAALAPALQKLTGLTCFKAVGCFSPAAMVTISPALMGMRQLLVLNLNHCKMSSEGTAAFAAALPALAGSLTHLYLASCSMSAQAAANAFAPALAKVTGLVELLMGCNHLGPQGAEWLVPVLSALPHLHVVGLSSCKLGQQGCMAVARALRDRDGAWVYLCDNGVTRRSTQGKRLCSMAGITVLL